MYRRFSTGLCQRNLSRNDSVEITANAREAAKSVKGCLDKALPKGDFSVRRSNALKLVQISRFFAASRDASVCIVSAKVVRGDQPWVGNRNPAGIEEENKRRLESQRYRTAGL